MVAIPSYNRAEELKKYTLSTILNKNIDPACIDIFVANQQQYDFYKDTIPNDMYNEIIITEKGKMNAINHIRRYYRKGQKLLNLDDDVSEVEYLYNDTNVPLNDLSAYSEYIFTQMRKNKCALAGIKRHRTARLKRHTLIITKFDVDGGFYWTINNPSPKLDVYCDNCEDLEFTLKNIEYYGRVMISNELSFGNESLNKRNDLIRLASYEEMAKTRMKLKTEYPHLLRFAKKSKDGSFPYPVCCKEFNDRITIPTVVKKW